MDDIKVRDFHFTVQEGFPVVECINLLAQVMASYKDLTAYERSCIAEWFKVFNENPH